MSKQTKQLLRLSMVLFVVFIMWCCYLVNQRKRQSGPTIISIVVYDSDEERWESLREGAEMAAAQYNAEIRLVAITKELYWQEQVQLFERELRNGTDAFLIAAADSAALARFFTDNEFPYPYQMVETGLEADSNHCIEVNNYQMGVDLATQLLQKEDKSAKVAVIIENGQRESVEKRYNGFMDTMKAHNSNVVIWERMNGEEGIQTKLLLQKMLTQEAVDMLVALDNSTLEAAIDAVTNLNKECGIYGVGNSDQTVSALDSGTCKVLAYQDEFSIGYIGVKKLLKEMKTNMIPEYRIVTRDNMYIEENEKMLFPFVK